MHIAVNTETAPFLVIFFTRPKRTPTAAQPLLLQLSHFMVGRNGIVFSGYKSHERQRIGMDRAEQKKNWGKLNPKTRGKKGADRGQGRKEQNRREIERSKQNKEEEKSGREGRVKEKQNRGEKAVAVSSSSAIASNRNQSVSFFL